MAFNKLITKLLDTRLSLLLPHIIFPQQSNFVPGRLIGDNILLTREFFHRSDDRVHGKKYCAEPRYGKSIWSYGLGILLLYIGCIWFRPPMDQYDQMVYLRVSIFSALEWSSILLLPILA